MKSNTFERICRGWGWSLLLALVTASGCGGQQAGDAALASSGAEATVAATAPDFSPTFFSARADLRTCASPMCGGYFVASVNQSWIRCPNGTYSRECYVASIDLSALKLSSDQEAQVRKAIGTSPDIVGVLLQGKLSAPPVTTAIAPVYPTLVAAHAWLAPAPTPIKGAYFGLADSGIVCITAPCPSIRGLLLNQTLKASFSQVDLSATASRGRWSASSPPVRPSASAFPTRFRRFTAAASPASAALARGSASMTRATPAIRRPVAPTAAGSASASRRSIASSARPSTLRPASAHACRA